MGKHLSVCALQQQSNIFSPVAAAEMHRELDSAPSTELEFCELKGHIDSGKAHGKAPQPAASAEHENETYQHILETSDDVCM